MDENRFFELIACFGADLDRWPEDERIDAEALLQDASHRMRDVWESERMFDALLAKDVEPRPSLALEARILDSMPRPVVTRSVRGLFSAVGMQRWLTGWAVAASLGLGFIVGYAGEPVRSDADYAQMLSISGAGAGEVFFSAVGDFE